MPEPRKTTNKKYMDDFVPQYIIIDKYILIWYDNWEGDSFIYYNHLICPMGCYSNFKDYISAFKKLNTLDQSGSFYGEDINSCDTFYLKPAVDVVYKILRPEIEELDF